MVLNLRTFVLPMKLYGGKSAYFCAPLKLYSVTVRCYCTVLLYGAPVKLYGAKSVYFLCSPETVRCFGCKFWGLFGVRKGALHAKASKRARESILEGVFTTVQSG